MPEREPQTAAAAGISPPEQIDVAALFARLKEEVRHAPGLDVSNGLNRGLVRTRLRSVAERWWPVSAERPLERRPGARGALLYPVKKVLRRLMRFYVEPFAADQRAFNDAALKLVDELFEEVDLAFGRLDRAERELEQRREDARRVAELEERLTRVERRRDGAAPATVAAQPAAAALPDYFAFEARMRGRSEEIRERQRRYVDDFRAAAPVLDVGCGRGELLSLLRDAGVAARGIDADADMVAYAQGEGLDVQQADLVDYLGALEDGALGAIFMAQVVEHLPPEVLARTFELAAAKLRPGGVLIAETINPLSPIALRNYFADLTHAQPLVPETLELLARQSGFAETELRFLNQPAERLTEPDDPVIAANVRRLNELLFAPLDYALVARTPATDA